MGCLGRRAECGEQEGWWLPRRGDAGRERPRRWLSRADVVCPASPSHGPEPLLLPQSGSAVPQGPAPVYGSLFLPNLESQPFPGLVP